MYFIINYDILDPAKAEEISAYIKSQLDGLAWVKPTSNMIVVQSRNETKRRKILDELITYSNNHLGSIRFLMTPLISSGTLTGVANTSLWPHIKKITAPDIEASSFIA